MAWKVISPIKICPLHRASEEFQELRSIVHLEGLRVPEYWYPHAKHFVLEALARDTPRSYWCCYSLCSRLTLIYAVTLVATQVICDKSAMRSSNTNMKRALAIENFFDYDDDEVDHREQTWRSHFMHKWWFPYLRPVFSLVFKRMFWLPKRSIHKNDLEAFIFSAKMTWKMDLRGIFDTSLQSRSGQRWGQLVLPYLEIALV